MIDLVCDAECDSEQDRLPFTVVSLIKGPLLELAVLCILTSLGVVIYSFHAFRREPFQIDGQSALHLVIAIFLESVSKLLLPTRSQAVLEVAVDLQVIPRVAFA